MRHLVRGIIDQNVHSTEFDDTSSDDLNAVLLPLNISSYHKSPSASIPNNSGSFLSVRVLVKVRDNYVGSFSSKGHRHCPSYATVASGNYSYLSA
jgi:hypothetical protein